MLSDGILPPEIGLFLVEIWPKEWPRYSTQLSPTPFYSIFSSKTGQLTVSKSDPIPLFSFGSFQKSFCKVAAFHHFLHFLLLLPMIRKMGEMVAAKTTNQQPKPTFTPKIKQILCVLKHGHSSPSPPRSMISNQPPSLSAQPPFPLPFFIAFSIAATFTHKFKKKSFGHLRRPKKRRRWTRF
jgi:hypothetical protein